MAGAERIAVPSRSMNYTQIIDKKPLAERFPRITIPGDQVKMSPLLRLMATADFPWWKKLLWRLLRRPVLYRVKDNWPQRFEWADDDDMTWN